MTQQRRIRTLVVDDEEPARLNMGALLAEHADVDVVASCSSGREALDHVARREVDLVVLDVRMPGMSGLDVLRALDPERPPAVVLVTAFERHAISAFELAAVDYLLKPVNRRRLAEMLQRVRSRLDAHDATRHLAELRRLVTHLESESLSPDGATTLDRLVIRSGRRRAVVPVDQIRLVEADGNYVRIHTDHGDYLHRATIGSLEAGLPADRFLRVHRSAIVRVDAVRALEPRGGRGFDVVLDDGSRTACSRRRAPRFRALLTSRR